MDAVWVSGEALIDLLPGQPSVGGGPANTAKALANLGMTTSFVGGISSDEYGSLISTELDSYGVDLGLVNRSNLPTALAVVSLDENGSASYEFKLDKTATFDFAGWLPSGAPAVLHVGTLATIVEPGASDLFEWASGLSDLGVKIVFDPNVRSSYLSYVDLYRSFFEQWVGISDVVKASIEDLEFLGYSVDEVLDLGAELLVVTKGGEGLVGYMKDVEVAVPGVSVSVVDTVGAGDTVGAVLVEGIVKYGELNFENLEIVLSRAAVAAAITCTRSGAKPPTLVELESYFR